MTAIAFKDGVLAADRGTFAMSLVEEGQKLLVLDTPNHGRIMFAGAGTVANIAEIVVWLMRSVERKDDKPNFYGDADTMVCSHGIMVNYEGKAFQIYGTGLLREIPEGCCLADGSEYQFLYGAMAAGADAPDAVALAIKYTQGAAIGVDAFHYSELSSWCECVDFMNHAKKSRRG